MRVRRAAFAAGAGLVLVSCSAAGSNAHGGVKTVLVFPGANPSGIDLPAKDSANIATVGSMILCVTGPLAPITVTSVTPYRGNGHLSVVAVATRPNPMLRKNGIAVAVSLKSLHALGFPSTSAGVAVPCNKTQDPKTHRVVPASSVEMAVTFRRIGDVTGSDHGSLIHHVVDGQAKEVVYPISLTMCGSTDHSTDCS